MKIKLISQFKSIKELTEIELPKFVILTGINGAGKTQLLQGIAAKKITLEINGHIASNVKSYSGGLAEVQPQTFYASKLEHFSISLQNKIHSFAYQKKTFPQGNINFETYFTANEKAIIHAIKQARNITEEYLTYADRLEIMSHISPYMEIPDPVKKSSYLQKQPFNDIFQNDLSQTFKCYQILQEQNNYNSYLKERKNKEDLEVLSDKEFLEKYGDPPWILANEILTSAGLGYFITSPEDEGVTDSFTAKLINYSNQQELSFTDLSSGEKVLMSLTLALYNANFNRTFPDVLLLDEPDCHLHPSMAGRLLNVIEEVFVKSRNVAVIMTTHSPSTVALASNDYLYVMVQEGGRLSKQSKDRCIKVLTTGVPALSINYDNRIQVFVESKYDAKNYTDIYEALKTKLDDEISLSFISSGSGGSGSSNQVKEIVSVLRRNGNSRVYGLIDWDAQNVGSKHIKVLASQKRYSLENLIFDPLIVSIYLIREGIVQPQILGLDAEKTYIKLTSLTDEECQKLSTFIISELSDVIIPSSRDESIIKYIGGFTVSVENWYLSINGHNLEAWIKKCFPPLKRFRNENDLKSDIIRKVMTDFPQFVPLEFIETFQSLSNQHLS